MDDSETSLCEMDDSSMPANPAADHRLTSAGSTPGNSIPFGALMVPPGGNGPPTAIHPPSPQFAMMNGGANAGHLISTTTPTSLMFSPPPGNNVPNHIDANMLHLSGANPPSIHPNMTPIDKLYSMQNSYFNNPSECEC